MVFIANGLNTCSEILPQLGARILMSTFHGAIRLIVLGFTDTSTLVGHFVSSPRESEIEEIVEEMKERGREERGTGMKGKKQKK